MAQCGICEQREGVREAGVYMDGEKKAVPVCAHCVYEAMRKNFYGIGFGAGLQLCWFVVASKGLASLPGMFARGDCFVRPCAPCDAACGAPCAAGCPGQRRPCAGVDVEICHGPGRYGGRPARCVCRAVLQCEGADAARVRAPARGKVTACPGQRLCGLARRL